MDKTAMDKKKIQLQNWSEIELERQEVRTDSETVVQTGKYESEHILFPPA